MNDPHDQLFDAFLSEALGEQSPPDVSDPVLAALRDGAKNSLAERRSRPAEASAPRVHRWWLSLAGVVVLGVSLGMVLLAWESWQRRRPEVRGAAGPIARVAEDDLITPRPDRTEPAPDRAVAAESQAPKTESDPNVWPNRGVESGRESPGNDELLVAAGAEPLELARLVDEIDFALETAWSADGVTPAPRLSREQWAERVVDTLLPDFVDRQQVIEVLTAGHPQVAVDRMTQLWWPQIATTLADRLADRLLSGLGGVDPTVANDLRTYLQQRLVAGSGWSSLVRGMLDPWSASDSSDPVESVAARRPDDAWLAALVAAYGPQSPELATHVGHTLLNSPLGCARCHDHADQVGRAIARLEFWQLQSYFLQLNRDGGDQRVVRRDYLPDGRPNDSDAPLFFDEVDGRLAAAYPAFAGKVESSPSGLLREFDRTGRIAVRVANSESSRAGAVDMLWEVVLGYPLVAFSGAWPIEANEQFVPLRRQLAQQMEAHEDLGVIVRAAVLSDAFWRGPDHEADSIDYPQLGTPAYFSYRYPKPSARLGVGESLAQLDQQLRSGTAPAGTFARIAQGIEAAAASSDNQVSSPPLSLPDHLPQSIRDWGAPEPVAVELERIALSDMNETEKFRHFFRIGLGRDPNQREIELCGSIAVLTQDPIAGFQEVWASIVLSSEFNR